ncbi:hypothetical protein WA026_007925 [Henosepilachna vigintioctopunctata]|uniref:Uncharacterized protein n=1 Tax=Henosepilachna vigintioctopunctata TaxID=420089 RepID=A0AAW1U6J9_9CUCU
MEASKSIEPVQIIDYTNPEQSFNSAIGNSKQNMLQFANIQNTPGYTSDKLKNIFEGESPSNIEIIFKTSDGNFVTVNDEVLQNISKGGLQYQIVDENGHVSEIQDFKPLERSQTQQNLDMLKEFMKSTKISGNDVAQTVCENVSVSSEPTATESVNVIDDKTEISAVLPGGPEIDDDRKPIQFMLLDNGDFDSNMLAPFTQAIKICEDKSFPDCPELSRQVDVDEVSDFDHSTSCDKSSLKFSPDIFFADSTTGSVCSEKKFVGLRKN